MDSVPKGQGENSPEIYLWRQIIKKIVSPVGTVEKERLRNDEHAVFFKFQFCEF
jgi:hypothetical protein